jgi:hypothetical protein
MRKVDVKDKVQELGANLPPVNEFWTIGGLTALRSSADGRFYRSNYERGLLLYTMVAKYQPSVTLEFGTGRGFGALCMARAMVDNDIDGKIYTINLHRFDERLEWAINEGNGSSVESLSIQEVWAKHVPVEWATRIHHICGNSVDIMAKWRSSGFPDPDLAFIDGGHDYRTVKHDYYSMLAIAVPSKRILFDCYAVKLDFGVCKLIDDEVDPVYESELIFTDRRWFGGENENEEDPAYGMVLVDCDRTRSSVKTPSAIRRDIFLTGYRMRSRLRKTPSAALSAKAKRAAVGFGRSTA